jgi:predicted nucleotidyltransferase
MNSSDYDKIIEHFKIIEKENNIKVIFSSDTGSRSKNLQNSGSDYDIKFIYIHNDFLLNFSSNRKMNKLLDCTIYGSDDGLFNFKGYTLDRAYEMLSIFNVTIIEILYSNLVIIDNSALKSEFINFIKKINNKKNVIYQYLSFSKRQYIGEIKNKKKYNYKSYIYVLRPILVINYLLRSKDDHEFILHNFDDLFEYNLDNNLIDDIHKDIMKIVNNKRNNIIEIPEHESLDKIDTFIDTFYDDIHNNKTSINYILFNDIKIKNKDQSEITSIDFYNSMIQTLRLYDYSK